MFVFPSLLLMVEMMHVVGPMCQCVDVSQASGTPWQVIIACSGKDCQYTETSWDYHCSTISYFTTDYFKEKNGKCTFGYNSEGRKFLMACRKVYDVNIPHGPKRLPNLSILKSLLSNQISNYF